MFFIENSPAASALRGLLYNRVITDEFGQLGVDVTPEMTDKGIRYSMGASGARRTKDTPRESSADRPLEERCPP